MCKQGGVGGEGGGYVLCLDVDFSCVPQNKSDISKISTKHPKFPLNYVCFVCLGLFAARMVVILYLI